MINPAIGSKGFEYTLADSAGKGLPSIEKKALAPMGEPAECHMATLFKPNTFAQKLESLSRPNISDAHLLNPTQFKRTGEETRQILTNMDIPAEHVINILSSHKENETLLTTFRNLLINI